MSCITDDNCEGSKICDNGSCNCPPFSGLDCNGVCAGSSILDCGGNCYDPNTGSPTVVKDCAGTCDGSELPDCSGVCGGTKKRDCAGVCDGPSIPDCGDNCYDPNTGSPTIVPDCN